MAFSQPTRLFIFLQGLALQLPPWLLVITDYLPLQRLRSLRNAKASSLAFARNLIREKRAEKELLKEDRHILSILSMYL